MLHNRQTVAHELFQSPDQKSETNLANETAWSVKGLIQIAPLHIYAETKILSKLKLFATPAALKLG